MEINKQLFEDVLSGKLKGKFVLRNGETYSSANLCRNYNKSWITHPYMIAYGSYTPEGVFSMYYGTSSFDIIDFIPETNMKQNYLTIEIPDGKIVDWDESKKQNKIVFKDKQLTYNDVCKKLFENKEFFFTNSTGVIESSSPVSKEYLIGAKNNSTSYHQLECIMAKNMLANTAKYLNDGWKPSFGDIYVLTQTSVGISAFRVAMGGCASDCGSIWFKSIELAQQAIEILGEETIKLALEPLGI